jgi:hypothetical protein
MVVATRNRNSKEESLPKRVHKPNTRYLDVDTEVTESKRKGNCKSNSCKSNNCKSGTFKNNILYKRILYPSDTWDTGYRNKHLPTLLIEQKNRCKLCLHKIKNKESITVDHIVQKQYCTIYSQPKIDQISNLQALCSYCNGIKTNIIDKKINKLIEEDDVRTRTYDGLRSYTNNLLKKTYRIEQESLAKVKETNQDMNSSDSEDDSEDESDKKSVEKVFSTLRNVSQSSKNDSTEEDSTEEDDLEDFINNYESKSKDNNPISKKKEVQRVTRSKTGSLPVKIQKPNVIITKSKESDSRNSVKRKIDYDSDDEVEFDNEIMIPKKVQKEETSQKKKDDKYISFIFKGCTFNNCTISL